jgi:hypothetical protein
MEAIVWEELKKKELMRAFEFCQTILKSPLTFEEFETVWYDEHNDKKGLKHLSNMCMSIFQARKASAGNSFEKYVELILTKANIHILKQTHVDDSGKIYRKKPTTSSHKVDYIIQYVLSDNISDSVIISAKKTFRERWRQDLCHIDKCKKLIYLTNETPNDTLIDSIVGYNTIIVFPEATLTSNIWTFDEFISRMKQFQQTGGYSIA